MRGGFRVGYVIEGFPVGYIKEAHYQSGYKDLGPMLRGYVSESF